MSFKMSLGMSVGEPSGLSVSSSSSASRVGSNTGANPPNSGAGDANNLASPGIESVGDLTVNMLLFSGAVAATGDFPLDSTGTTLTASSSSGDNSDRRNWTPPAAAVLV